MRKHVNFAFGYAIAALVAGVFYREFTKWMGFEGPTMLGKMHGHLLALGMLFFLLVALFAALTTLEERRGYRAFMVSYNTGLILTVQMMLLRGILEVRGVALSRALDASIAGFAGLGHILLGLGLVLFLLAARGVELKERNRQIDLIHNKSHQLDEP